MTMVAMTMVVTTTAEEMIMEVTVEVATAEAVTFPTKQ